MTIDRSHPDYTPPEWDDRKELASLYQDHARLPEEGLSAGFYQALIAVARWGYDQRVEETSA
jgi:hypothetical protein